jgi:hypothetical protein
VDGVASRERALVAALGLVATVALAGAQGARLGSWVVAELSPWWVVAAAAAVLAFTPRHPSRARRLGLPGGALAVSFVLLFFLRSESLHRKTPLDFVVDGERSVSGDSLQIERRSELRRLTGKRRNVSVETRALLEVPRPGTYAFQVFCDDECEVEIGGEVLAVEGWGAVELELEAGDVPLGVRYRQRGGPARFTLSWDTPRLLELLPLDHYVRAPAAEPRKRWAAHAALASCSLWFVALGLYLGKLGRMRSRWMASPRVPVVLAGLLVCYGSLLRFEALLAHSGLAEREGPFALTHEILFPALPDFGVLHPENAPEDPYRADVRSYLDRAASMSETGFYAPSFREPFYVFVTWVAVRLAGGEIGILIQSLFFSCLTLPLFWWVGRKLYGAWWALLLLVPVSLHEWLVLEAPTGYRMSAYSFLLLGFVSLLLLGRDDPRSAALAGGLAGLVSLVRLSALAAIVPAFALRLLRTARRERLACAAAFALALSLVVGPFLLSNYRAHGDPWYSVSFHTEFWLRAEGLDRGQGPVSLVSYFSDFGRARKFVEGNFLGLTVLPLRTFWNGLRFLPLLGIATLTLGVLGLLALSKEVNRFLAAAYFGHLLPFAYIQNFPSGEMPRFVMPAYFFLVLAIPAAAAPARALARRLGL